MRSRFTCKQIGVADRSKCAAFRPVDSVEPAGFARTPRQPAGHPVRPRVVVCGADLPASRSESRIDQNAQLSGQLTLWNQQGSHVRRGSLLVIPCGRALLYAEPIYLQAERSPMPELRLVVLALQDRLAYAPTFEAALASLFGSETSSLS